MCVPKPRRPVHSRVHIVRDHRRMIVVNGVAWECHVAGPFNAAGVLMMGGRRKGRWEVICPATPPRLFSPLPPPNVPNLQSYSDVVGTHNNALELVASVHFTPYRFRLPVDNKSIVRVINLWGDCAPPPPSPPLFCPQKWGNFARTTATPVPGVFS